MSASGGQQYVWRGRSVPIDMRDPQQRLRTLRQRQRLDTRHCIESAMALPHADPNQRLDVRPLGQRLAETKTSALFKSMDLEVMRLVLTAGRSLPPHQVPGEITIQCLEGSLDITLDDGSVRLEAGDLVYLARNARHGVLALTDASALVTIALLR